MRVRQILLAAGLVALSATTLAQPERDHRNPPPVAQPDRDYRSQQPSDPAERWRDRALNPQPLPPEPPERWRDRALNPQPLPPEPPERWNNREHRRERDFRHDRDHRNWNDRDQRRNFEMHRDRHHELRIGMRKHEVLRFDWWEHPIYIRHVGPFEDYFYADSRRYGQCWLRFGPRGRLLEIHC